MQRQCQFIIDAVSRGDTVLAYNRALVKPRIYHIRSMDRVRMIGGILHIDRIPTKGWTFAIKP